MTYSVTGTKPASESVSMMNRLAVGTSLTNTSSFLEHTPRQAQNGLLFSSFGDSIRFRGPAGNLVGGGCRKAIWARSVRQSEP